MRVSRLLLTVHDPHDASQALTEDPPDMSLRLPLLAAFVITPSVPETALNSTLSSRAAGFSFLVRSSAAQDERFRAAFSLIDRAITAHAFPACSLAVAGRGELMAHKAFGHFTYDPASAPVTTCSIFDLASVSKVVATTTMAMILY